MRDRTLERYRNPVSFLEPERCPICACVIATLHQEPRYARDGAALLSYHCGSAYCRARTIGKIYDAIAKVMEVGGIIFRKGSIAYTDGI